LREAALAAEKTLEEYEIKEGMNDELYKALKDYKIEAIKSKEWEKISKEDQRFVDKTTQDFRKNGIELPADKRTKL
jgi:Zn-dependent oligopeptidase